MATCRARHILAAGPPVSVNLICWQGEGHTGLHLDRDHDIWWDSTDSRAVTSSGHTQTTAETSVTDKIAAAVGGLGEDWRLKEHPEAERIGNMLEQLAARIRDGA